MTLEKTCDSFGIVKTPPSSFIHSGSEGGVLERERERESLRGRGGGAKLKETLVFYGIKQDNQDQQSSKNISLYLNEMQHCHAIWSLLKQAHQLTDAFLQNSTRGPFIFTIKKQPS